jgi:hypothetical protein
MAIKIKAKNQFSYLGVRYIGGQEYEIEEKVFEAIKSEVVEIKKPTPRKTKTKPGKTRKRTK